MSRRHLYSVAPNAPFLSTLADRILDGTLLNGWDRTGPFWLADITIILPTRRARLTLAEIFAQRLGGAALLPDIRTFGGESAEEEPFLPPVDAPAQWPVATLLERRLTLSRLVDLFARSAEGFATPPNAAEVFALADSFGQLIDDLTIERVEFGKLETLVGDDLAENWQDVLRFLEPALRAWPKILGEHGKIDDATARNERLHRQAANAPLVYGDRPVIAAGSTGSIPATAELLKAIGGLERGALVLPGLDTSLTAEQHERLADGADTQGHAQYGLAKLLRALGAGIGDVEELADDAPRTALVRAALAPAGETAHWGERRAGLPVDEALAGVSVIAAPNADLEARAIALAARQAILDRHSVGIVSRDQTLARRIAAELMRHGIEVDDPAGAPLFQSGAGRLVRQVLAVAVEQYAPVDLIALLRNGAVALGRSRGEVQKPATRLDLKLRRERTLPGLAGVLALAEDGDLRSLLEDLGTALAPLCDLLEQPHTDAPSLVASLRGATEALLADGELPGLGEFRAWADEFATAADKGVPFAPVTLDGVLAALMAGTKVQSGARRRDDIHIWGELEARLQSPDLMILAGVNEDIWPPAADPGPWLSRKMRIDVGLEPPERQQGQAAHDFEMALGNAEVIVAYALRMGTAPALRSRLLQRVDAFVGEDAAQAMRNRGEHWLHQAAAIDFAGLPRPASRPLPSPPAAMRPRRLSVTEIETLMRSPYDIYAKHTLHLKKLDPLGSEPSARERGTMIHAVFEQFVAKGLSFFSPDAEAQLKELAEESFRNLESISERRAIWIKRFERASKQFLEWERERHGSIASRAAESRGALSWPTLQNFVLTGKADRIDQRTDGLLEILDFKTGGVPQPKDMIAFEAPQLLLEAAMARAGAFEGIPSRASAELTYIKIGLGPAAFQTKRFSVPKGMSLDAAVDEIERRTQGHVDAFLIRDGLPMAARIKPRASGGRKPYPGDYDHLARTDEWTLTAGVDDP